MKFCLDAHGPQTMYPTDVCDHLTFLPSAKQGLEFVALSEMFQQLSDGLSRNLPCTISGPLRMICNSFDDPFEIWEHIVHVVADGLAKLQHRNHIIWRQNCSFC